MKASDLVLARFDHAIEEALARWVDEISELAAFPIEENFSNADEYHEAVRDFDDFLAGEETRNISRLLFQLKSVPVDTPNKMKAIIEAHNEQIKLDLSDNDYDLRTGISKGRLREAQMLSEGEREILLNAVARHGPGVLHESGYARFLVRISNQNRINKTMTVLKDAGLIRVLKGANNAKLIVSDGALEDAHRNYLTRVGEAAQEV